MFRAESTLMAEGNLWLSNSARASKMAGIPVQNPEQDYTGEIDEVVIDLEAGTIAYAVLRFRSWFRDKLFAIPWKVLTQDEDGHYFVLDTTRETR